MIQQTSLLSYNHLLTCEKLSQRRQLVLDIIKHNPESTDAELVRLSPLKINQWTPRRGELYKLGLIRCVGKRPCKLTKRRAMIWEAK